MSGFSYAFFFVVPIEDSAVHPCDPAIQIRKSMTAPPKGGGIYKKMHSSRRHDIRSKLRERLHRLTWSLQKDKNLPLFRKGRKHGYTRHTLPLFFQWHSIHRVCTYTPHTQASVHVQIMSVSLSVNGTEHVHLLWGMGSKAVGHSFPRPWHSEATVVTKVSFHNMMKYRNIITHLGLECIFYLYFCTFNLINFPRIWWINRKSLFLFILLTWLLIVTVVHRNYVL